MFDACSCGYGDGETCDVTVHKIVKGRKDWKCIECHEVIPKGTEHHWLKSLFEGAWEEDRWCMRCDAIREDAVPCAPLGCLYEYLRECYGEDVA